jgi:hypothetical protein
LLSATRQPSAPGGKWRNQHKLELLQQFSLLILLFCWRLDVNDTYTALLQWC